MQGSQKEVALNQSVFAANDALADQIAAALKKKGIFCVNIMGTPGAGKTTIIEGLARIIGAQKIAVIQGDLASDVDKRRLEEEGIDTHQINTHSGCHLNAHMVNGAVLEMDLTGKDYLLIENVGNLVCPAGVKVGQHCNVLISAVTEGDDKPEKYPIMFADADIVVISKYNLKDAVGFDEVSYRKRLEKVTSRKVITATRDPSRELVAFIAHRADHLFGRVHKH